MILCVSGLGVGSRVENVVCALSVTVSLAAVCLLSDNHLFQITRRDKPCRGIWISRRDALPLWDALESGVWRHWRMDEQEHEGRTFLRGVLYHIL